MKKSNKKASKAPKINGKKSEGMTVAQVIRCILEAFKEQSEVIANLELKLAVLEARVGLYYEIQKNTYEIVKELKPKTSVDKPYFGVVKPAKGNVRCMKGKPYHVGFIKGKPKPKAKR